MAELYPSDADLNALSGTADSQQEVLYVPTGESPYYTSFYKMLYRLLDVARRAGDLRVYKDGDLTFGVRAGKFFDGDTLREYAGATGQSLTNNATNYIYLLADGTLTVNTSGFPAPSAAPHLRLAVITTSGGTYAPEDGDLEDWRGTALLTIPRVQPTAALNVPLVEMKKVADGLALPTSPDGTNLGYQVGTFGTATPYLMGSHPSGGTETETARFQFILPENYVAGGTITLRLRAKATNNSQVKQEIDASAYVSDGEAGATGDLVSTAAQTLTTSYADYDFTLTPTGRVAGELLDIKITTDLDDTGGGAGLQALIGEVQLLIQVRG